MEKWGELRWGHQMDQFWNNQLWSCSQSNNSNANWMRMLVKMWTRMWGRMWTRMWARMWCDWNNMKLLLEKYVNNLLRINSCLFYIDWLIILGHFLTPSVPYTELFWSRCTSLGSQTQTPKCWKVLNSSVSFHQHSLSQSQESDILSYSECKIAKNFQGFTPGCHWGGVTAPPQTSQMHNSFFSFAMLIEKQAPPKNCWIWHCPSHFCTGSIKVYYITHVLLHVITRITSCVVLFLHSKLRFCCDKMLFEEIKIWKEFLILNSKILNIEISYV